MRQLSLLCVALLGLSTLSFAATHRKPVKKSVRSAASGRKTKGRARSHYRGPQGPTPERYREIQQRLADKGFFHGSVDGKWSSDSVDALKRFQKEQGLDPDGKLGSLSLIAMGLGPKRLAAQASMPPPAGTQR